MSNDQTYIDKVKEDLQDTLEGVDSIEDILKVWKEINKGHKQLEKLEERAKNKIKIYLKERKWEDFKDSDTKIHIKLSLRQRKSIDKDQLKTMLSEAQLARVIRITSYEQLDIITPERRKELSKIVKKRKN